MIESEILKIIDDTDDRGELLNELADQFRNGRDVNELAQLLESSDPELIAIGAWILGEMEFGRYNSGAIISRLRELASHSVPTVRFHVLGALYPSFDAECPWTRTLLDKLSHDPNEGVRVKARATATRLFLK